MTRKRHLVKHIFVLLLAAVLLLGTITAAQAASAILTKQPMDASAVGTGTVNFTVDASGSNLTYQWQYKNPSTGVWKNCSSATKGYNTDTLTVAGVSGTTNRNGYQYRCVVTSGSTKLTSNAATLTVYAIKTQPESATVDAGETAEFRVAATGKSLVYQWQYKNPSTGVWKNCSSATKGYNTNTLTVVGVSGKTNRSGYQYRCVVTSGDVKLTSAAATLTVSDSGDTIAITTHPVNAAAVGTGTASFKVVATGKNLVYQWQYKNPSTGVWKNCSSATKGYNTDTLTVAGVSGTTNRNGYQYRCVVTSGAEKLTSNAATLTVKEPGTVFAITSHPVNATAVGTETVNFKVTATGKDLSYQWQYKNPSTGAWKNCSSTTKGYNTDTLTVAGTSGTTNRNGYQYRCVVTCGAEKLTSNAATLTVTKPVVLFEIISHPQDAAGNKDDKAIFRIEATGVGLTYQWQYSTDNGETWLNASSTGTKATCTINKTSDGWLYRCIVTDSSGAQKISNAARIIWQRPLKIVKQPVDTYGNSGSTVELTVNAEGWNLRYSWEYSADQGVTWIPAGCTDATIACPLDNTTAGRMYRCVVTNGDNTTETSNVAAIYLSSIVIDPDTGLAYYIMDGNVKLTGWQHMEDGTRYFDANGSMARGVCAVNGKKYYFDWNTGLQRFGMIDVGAGHYMYFDETTGNPVSGLKEVDGFTYYFSEESYTAQGGLETVGSDTYYFDPDTYHMLTGLIRIKQAAYYFDENGKMQTGLIQTNDGAYYAREDGSLYSGTFTDPVTKIRYWADEDTYQLRTGFYEPGGASYYFDGTNGAASGLTWIDGKLYYLAADGRVKNGLYDLDGKRYLFDSETGEAVFGLVSYGGRIYGLTEDGASTGLTYVDGALYYFSDSGYAYLGLQAIDGDKYYFDPATGQACNGWKTLNGSRYYFEDYKAIRGESREINGVTYTFNAGGTVRNPNPRSGCVTENGVKKYYDPETGERKLGFITLDGSTFYYTENGVATGMLELEDGAWYFDVSGVMRKGMQKIGGKGYYFDPETGRRCTGLVESDGKLMYADPETGELQTGLMKIDGKEYYFRPDQYTMKTWWLTVDEKNNIKYYFNSKGERQTGFVSVSGYTYYLDDGPMHKGLTEINGSTYFFSSNGFLLRGARTIDDKAYFFDTETGAMRTGLVELNGKWYGYLPEGGLASGFHNFNGKTYYFKESNNQLVLGLYSDREGNLYNFDLERGMVKNDDWVWEGVSFHADSNGKVSVTVDESNPFSKLMARGIELLGTPYGKKDGQLVCSSLAKTVMQAVNVNLVDTVNRQYTKLMSDNAVDKDFSVDALRKGDAVFYLNGHCGRKDCHEINEIHHVGIYLGGGKMLEAASFNYDEDQEDTDGYTLIQDITNTDDVFVVMVAHLM